ncbi:isoleucine--tRNA ligase [Ornithinimicrobium tianjinense]|uniref:Isoleucine--tRNA ligase n=1 Tax=Ornithinimicrobium tianjinense TaxID=1195761 RepID=A0A917BI91_9MICO|nr:isoleucine--tRNA ligase [Ornithinimicrobium tianjinense]GGF42444.1 isoleucine--tRNA ligase [Ornithinimicrobium tianjinense]
MAYPLTSTSGNALTSSPRFPEIEEAVLAYWREHETFVKSVEARPAGENGANEFVFYDGPPFANGLPHYGHLLTGYVKDVVPRYQTMRGKRVERRFGWDTHGLPAELEAMSQLGIKTKDEILEIGIEAFNAKCRESVLKYTSEWEDYVTRQARWVDFEGDYKTLNVTFMESVLWAFKSLYDKGLVYEGFRVLPYCWNDQTPLSNHELRMDDEVYQVRQDPAVTVGVRLLPGEQPDELLDGALALVWTTTPWTLPANLAVMVGEDIEYVVVRAALPGAGEGAADQRYVLAKERLTAYRNELGEEPEVLATYTGAQLAGRSYVPPFTYYQGWERAHRVVVAEFVTTTDGTGLVHTAGAFGEDDKVVTDREGIEPVMPVGPDGLFTHPVAEYAGTLVFDANAPIQDHLKAATLNQLPRTQEHPDLLDQGSVSEGTVLLRRESYAHSYPHCWRCRQPLIYKAVSSWFVEVTRIKDDMLRTNEEITWVPEHVKHGQFGKWLENARDWSISRNRFWGSPIPVWRSDNPEYPRIDVYGSLEEIERDFGTLPRDRDGNVDLHRPFVDELTRPNPDDPTGQSTMRRVEDVLDVWFDSGSMSYAQVHYPFENAEWFEHHFPADFIVEYIGQTRGWFYTLHILSTALFDRPAFSTCVSHGIVLGNDGQKMSKSLKNYPDVRDVFGRDGADAMRWFLMSSPILRGGNLVVTEQGIRDGVRQTMIPLWNAWYFFGLYANAAGYQATWSTASTHELDRYLLAKTREFVEAAQGHYDHHQIAAACDTIREFVDVLTNWYIRRSRDRFWSEDHAAFDTLYTVLEVTCRVAAPLLPLLTEEVWRGLTGGESVHLTDWPAAEDLPADAELVEAMDTVREVCSVTLGLRKAEQLRVRLPLSSLTLVTPHAEGLAAHPGLSDIVRDEVNVREVTVLDLGDAAAADHGVEQRLTVNARAAGPRLGKDVQTAIKGSKTGDWWVAEDGTVTSGGLALVEGEYTLETVVADAADGAGSRATAMLRGHGGGFVVLDTEVTEELAREGLARDLVRAVQGARKDAGLEITDRISLTVVGDDDVWDAAMAHQQLVMDETLAVQFGAAGAGTPLPKPKHHGLGPTADDPGPNSSGTQPRHTAYTTEADLGAGRKVELMIAKVETR